ncbi:MAG: RluA family pseudouridine synthase [Deltaproteobacteria bacterium]|nr:RluA family pseudouridine synthase [Deltaproteobacteria bacterium]
MSSRREEAIASSAFERLDRAVAALVPGVSRRRARALIEAGAVFLDGRRCRIAGRPVAAGARIVAHVGPGGQSADPPITVCYSDEEILVIAKEPGDHVNETETSARESLVGKLSRATGQVFAVHRLDRETSGVIVFAKTLDVAGVLSKAFEERAVEKTYLALVEVAPAEGLIELPIGEDPRRPRARKVVAGGQVARTRVRVLSTLGAIALVEARPETGRTHQIRVHLAHVGSPLLGDRLYGGPSAVRVGDEVREVARVMLHAWRLEIPWHGARRAFEVSPPADFVMAARGLALPGDKE